jgi:outer membrane protein assembly factor BamB
VFVATSNGDIAAFNAFDADCKEGESRIDAGTLLWSTRLVTPGVPPRLDNGNATPPRFPGIAVGALATPVIDRDVLYATAMDAASDPPVWKLFALDLATGAVRPGFPVVFTRDAVEAKNTNGPAFFDSDARYVSQRSALSLSPEGDRVYVMFGGYWDEAVGWIVAVDVHAPAIAASFSGAPDTLVSNGVVDRHANAGMWAPGGASIDERGRIYLTTGNSPVTNAPPARTWGNSMLRLTRDLVLDASYTPWDACALDARDVDLGAASPLLLPPLDHTTTPSLVAFGGKAGVVYLVDRDAVPPPGASRPPCATSFEDAARDASLLPPAIAEPYCDGFGPDPCVAPRASTRCVRGPLAVFGPAGDDASVDHAKMRTTPAFFRDDNGDALLFVAGSTKAARCVADVVPPSLARLRVVRSDGAPAHLALDATDHQLRFVNPGSPVVSSNGAKSPVVWVLDQNARRTQPLLDPATPSPILYAIDGTTMELLWTTTLEPGGKYATPLVAHGTVFVATDRLHAFAP